VVNGRAKTLHPGKIVTTLLMGSQRLYDWVHDNPMLEMHGVEYTNDTAVIRRNARMTAINSAIQVDLTGQVCADSIGTRCLPARQEHPRASRRADRNRPSTVSTRAHGVGLPARLPLIQCQVEQTAVTRSYCVSFFHLGGANLPVLIDMLAGITAAQKQQIRQVYRPGSITVQTRALLRSVVR
jgi:hypothetical protein